MSKHVFTLLALLIAVSVSPGTALSQNDVTFQVKMNVKTLEGLFDPATDSVVVRGDFNGWGGKAELLTDDDADSIYVGTYNVGDTLTSIAYKFVMVTSEGDAWEDNISNREVALTGSPVTLPVVYFDNDSVVTTASDAITFQVDMSVKILEGAFDTASDIAVVRGSFNGWAGNADELTDADSDSIYTGIVDVLGSADDVIEYKFVMVTTAAGDQWEDNIPANRSYTLTGEDATLPVVFFDDDEVVSLPISGNLLWQVDMSAFEEMGWFTRAGGDSMEVRGSFNGWATGPEAILDRVPGTEVYQLVTPFDGLSGDNYFYKYFMNLDDATAETRYPGFSDNEDGIQFDHPAERGDGNRIHTLAAGNIEAPVFYFSDINPDGIVPDGKTITVTFQYDMAPALSFSDPFVPATDTLLLLIEDPFWRTITEVAPANNSDTGIQFTDPDQDGIWTAELTFTGPAYYAIQYRVRYVHMDGTQVDEGAGLGVQKPYNVRFIQPSGPREFPDTFTFDVVPWTESPPRLTETAPFSTVASVERLEELGLPLQYSLEQNYPNPFNPGTLIRYSIPAKSQVNLKLYNVLGQEVFTLLNTKQEAGTYEVELNAANFPSGVYFYRLEAGTFVDVKKMLLIK